MFPIAPPQGQITGTRPTNQSPDAPLSDDDRTGLRVLYPDPTDSVHIGAISGHVLPAKPPRPAHFACRRDRHLSRASRCPRQCNRNGDRRRDGRLELRRPGPAAIRRLVFPSAIDGGDFAELPDLRRAARWAGRPRERYLQFDVAVPELHDRSRLAGAICVHGAGIRGALFCAESAGTLTFLLRSKSACF